MKKCMAVLGVFLAFYCWASGHEYIMDTGVAATTFYAGTQITTLTGGTWDNGYYDMTLPANNQFYFYGKKVTHLRIWTNGYITCGFGAVPTDYSDTTPDVMPNSDNPNAYIAPWWDDWDLGIAGQIYYTIGSYGPGSQNWVTVKWNGVAHHADAAARYTFAVAIFAEYNYTDVPARRNDIMFEYMVTHSGTGTHDYGKTGTVGIEHYTGWQCEEYCYKTASLGHDPMDILFTPFVPAYTGTDYNGNGTPDVAVWRPDNGNIYYRYDNGSTAMYHWGTLGDVFLPGDYDGGGAAEDMVYRPSTGVWWGRSPFTVTAWGTHGDIPVPADYDNDGKTDLAVFRPSNGSWYIRYSSGGTGFIPWGTQGDIPVPNDYDNDGKADLAVYRTSTGVWWIRKSSNPATAFVIPWGADGDVPTPVSYYTTYPNPCVYRPSGGGWYVQAQNSGASTVFFWGADYDVPVPNDVTAGGASEFIVWRPSNGIWYEKYGQAGFSWGAAGDKPRSRLSRSIIAPSPEP